MFTPKTSSNTKCVKACQVPWTSAEAKRSLIFLDIYPFVLADTPDLNVHTARFRQRGESNSKSCSNNRRRRLRSPVALLTSRDPQTVEGARNRLLGSFPSPRPRPAAVGTQPGSERKANTLRWNLSLRALYDRWHKRPRSRGSSISIEIKTKQRDRAAIDVREMEIYK